MIVRRAGALALVALLLGCGGRQKTPELIEEVRGFGEGIRWHKHGDSALRIPVRERADFVAEREDIEEDLRIGDWELERIVWTTPEERATVRVTWTWHLDSRGLVHKTVSEQRWELHGKSWLMTHEERVRGEPMPGLAEPTEKSEPADGDARDPAPRSSR